MDNRDGQLTPMRFLRERVLGVPNQHIFADMVGVKQATVSRWEAGEFRPSAAVMKRIEKLADQRGIALDYKWFFEVPQADRRAA
jgi:transcriptional regulator with XRE-family HTH domain